MNREDNTKYQLSKPRGSVGLNPPAWKMFWLIKDHVPAMSALDLASKMVFYCFDNLASFLKEVSNAE